MSPSVLALSHTVCPSRSLVSSWPAFTLSLPQVRCTGTGGRYRSERSRCNHGGVTRSENGTKTLLRPRPPISRSTYPLRRSRIELNQQKCHGRRVFIRQTDKVSGNVWCKIYLEYSTSKSFNEVQNKGSQVEPVLRSPAIWQVGRHRHVTGQARDTLLIVAP